MPPRPRFEIQCESCNYIFTIPAKDIAEDYVECPRCGTSLDLDLTGFSLLPKGKKEEYI